MSRWASRTNAQYAGDGFRVLKASCCLTSVKDLSKPTRSAKPSNGTKPGSAPRGNVAGKQGDERQAHRNGCKRQSVCSRNSHKHGGHHAGGGIRSSNANCDAEQREFQSMTNDKPH